MTQSGRDVVEELRIDRWLWCARFFKTRTLAAAAVKGGHVRLNGQRVKPAREVKVGDALSIAVGTAPERDVTIVAIPPRRGPSAEAQGCYIETAESIERRRLHAERRAEAQWVAAPTPGRPDRRTRRLLKRVKEQA
jgi:ribosome-associated heat shock protein Hsp15